MAVGDVLTKRKIDMENSELYTVFPVFIVVDVSASMAGGPVDAMNAALPQLKEVMLSDPAVGEIARVCVVTFSDAARTIIPLCDLVDVEIPEIITEGGTNFAAAFRQVKAAIIDGLRSFPKGTPFYRPVVFFMSDGQHMAHERWEAALDDLRDKDFRFAPEIVSFGFGAADNATLQRIATRFAFVARDADPAVQVREIMKALQHSIRTTSRSIQDPAQAQGLHIEAPAEHFTSLPKLTL